MLQLFFDVNGLAYFHVANSQKILWFLSHLKNKSTSTFFSLHKECSQIIISFKSLKKDVTKTMISSENLLPLMGLIDLMIDIISSCNILQISFLKFLISK